MGRRSDRRLSHRALQRRGNRSRDLVFDREHVVDAAAVGLRPEVIAVVGVDELRRDAQPVSGALHTSFHKRIDCQRFTHFARIGARSLERKR